MPLQKQRCLVYSNLPHSRKWWGNTKIFEAPTHDPFCCTRLCWHEGTPNINCTQNSKMPSSTSP